MGHFVKETPVFYIFRPQSLAEGIIPEFQIYFKMFIL